MKKKLLGPLGFAAALAMGLTSLVAVTGPASAGATVPKSAAAPAGTDSTAAATTSPYLTGSTSYPFTFTQANGTKATLDAPPTRIVCLDRSDEDEEVLLALGTHCMGGSAFPAAMYGATVPAGSYKVLGGAYDDDLEAIAAEHPDLIVGPDSANDDLPQLSAIAPVANINGGAVGVPAPANPSGVQLLPFYGGIELLAQILDRQTQANAFWAKEATAIAKVKPLLQGITMDYLADFGGGTFDLYGSQFFDGSLFELLGITIPNLPPGGVLSEGTASGQDALDNFSDEQARVVTSQYILIQDYGTPAFQTLAIAKEVPAIKAGHYVLGGRLKGFPAVGPISNLALIPKFADALLAAGTPPYRAVGTVGKSGSLSGVNFNGYDGPLYTKSGNTYTHITNPGMKLAPGTTIYGV